MKVKNIIMLGSLFLCTAFAVCGAELGDVNNDSSINIVDALLIAQYAVGLDPNGFDRTVADVDGDGSVTIVDTLLVARYFVGLITWPPTVAGTENIVNGDFADGTTHWTAGYYSPGAGSLSVDNGELHIGITDGGTETWNVQISQGGINIFSGTDYTFTFDARSVSPRTIEANVGMSEDPYTSYSASGPLSLSTSMTTYSFDFTASANDTTARVEFNCGLDANDVYIDNVSLIGGSGPEPPEQTLIDFTDPILEAAIRELIDIPEGPIYNTDVYTIGSIDLSHLYINDINGLEHFSGLSNLLLNNNWYPIDLAPIENLTDMRKLNIATNHLIDITPIANMTNLTNLNIIVNQISDITPLANMTKMTELLCHFNDIVDITPLANLTNLTYLTLNDNHIIDITPLANLTKVTYLDLYNNQISDITPLANLTNLSKLNLCGNPINDITALGYLKKMTKLVLNVGTLEDISPLANCTSLTSLNLKNNNISDITPLVNLVNNLKVLSLVGNPLDASAEAVINLMRENGVQVDIRQEYFDSL
ncbi:MAG: leucine-rich repeat domain-containing protein [Spirochaetales bacterium]|nr:leucine-rich repeat domain-containing protein [Spirochaetales bacterium]